MISLTNILFIPSCGYFKNTERLISCNGRLLNTLITNRISTPMFQCYYPSASLEPSDVSSVHTRFFTL